MSNRKSNYNSLENMIRDMAASTTEVPIKLNIINNNNHLQTGGSNYNLQGTHNNSYSNVNKLLSMLADETSSQPTSEIETQLGNTLKMTGGKVSNSYSNKNELESFFRKYKINTVNGIKTKYFINLHGGAPDTAQDTPATSVIDDEFGTPVVATTTVASDNNDQSVKSASDTSDNDGLSAVTTPDSPVFSGGAGMNPGFQAFLNLKKQIAEELKISNGPKAAKIAGAVQKEMKAKYTNLNAVEIAAKGLEHFKKNHDKYKKMV